MYRILSPLSKTTAFYAQLPPSLRRSLYFHTLMLQKNIYAQKYTLSNTPDLFQQDACKILTHQSICLTFFLTLIACAFPPHWLHATVTIHLVPREQDFWDRNIFLATKATSYEKALFSRLFLSMQC